MRNLDLRGRARAHDRSVFNFNTASYVGHLASSSSSSSPNFLFHSHSRPCHFSPSLPRGHLARAGGTSVVFTALTFLRWFLVFWQSGGGPPQVPPSLSRNFSRATSDSGAGSLETLETVPSDESGFVDRCRRACVR